MILGVHQGKITNLMTQTHVRQEQRIDFTNPAKCHKRKPNHYHPLAKRMGDCNTRCVRLDDVL